MGYLIILQHRVSFDTEQESV